ncbi:TPA: hypothetical protein HA278_02525 [Candidatus Woesearchaeota archaeon]|nr:hypothetical protein [Candidatus Woesearchaeota archaeon]
MSIKSFREVMNNHLNRPTPNGWSVEMALHSTQFVHLSLTINFPSSVIVHLQWRVIMVF